MRSTPFIRVKEPKKTGDFLRSHKGRHSTETVEQRSCNGQRGAQRTVFLLVNGPKKTGIHPTETVEQRSCDGQRGAQRSVFTC
jgi:hypothetical protein